MPRTRLPLVLTVAALLLAMGCARALAQPAPPPTDPTFAADRDADYFRRITEALADLKRELDRVAGLHIPWRDAERVEDATKKVDELAASIKPPEAGSSPLPGDPADPELLDSIRPADQAEVDRLAEDAAAHANPAPRPDTEAPHVRDGWNSYNLATKWLTERLARMAAQNQAKQAGQAPPEAQPQAAPAPAEESVALRPSAKLHLTEDDPRQSVWQAAEEAAYWQAVLGRGDLTDEQRQVAEKRSRMTATALETAKEKAARQGVGADEIANLERDGAARGTEAGSAPAPGTEPPAPPSDEELAAAGAGKGTDQPPTQEPAPAGPAEPPADPKASLKQPPADGGEGGEGGLDGLDDVDGATVPTTTTLLPEVAGRPAVDDQVQPPGGKVEPPQLHAAAGPRDPVDWFAAGDDGLLGRGTAQGPVGGSLPPLDCTAKVVAATCPPPPGSGGRPQPPIDLGPTGFPLPGSGGGGLGEEDGCKDLHVAAFGTCGIDPNPGPDVNTPGGWLPPEPAGCGPAGVAAICTPTGPGGVLGGTRVTTTAPGLDGLFAPVDADGGQPPAAPPAVRPPDRASSLAA